MGYAKKVKGILWLIAIISTVTTILVVALGYWKFIFSPLILSFIIPFCLLLDNDMERFKKGISLILFGIFWSTFYLELLLPSLPRNELPVRLQSLLEMLSQMALLTSSGAGGGLIASYGEERSKDMAERVVKKVNLDNTKAITMLGVEILKQKRNFKVLYCLLGFVLILQLIQISS